MRAVLKTLLLSFSAIASTRSRSAATLTTPWSMLARVRNTPACCCIVARMSLATSCAYSPLVLASNRASRASDASAASLGKGLCAWSARLKLSTM